MSAIAAVFNRDGVPVTHDVIQHMSEARLERGPDGRRLWQRNDIGLAHQHFWITPEEWGETQPIVVGEYAISCDARLDNRRQLAAELQLDPAKLQEFSDARLIMLSYRQWGEACLAHLLGDYAFVLWDGKEQRLFFARDALGGRDICYYLDDRICLVASEISQVLAHPASPVGINENRVAYFLAVQWSRPEISFYDQIYYLPPAHAMVVSRERSRIWRHWDVDPDERIRYDDERDYTAHFLQLLKDAVYSRLRTVGPVGLSLSGGLDSTALAALAAPMLRQSGNGQSQLHSFSYIFDELSSCDEREFIQPVVDRYQLAANYVPCDDMWPLKNVAQWPVSRDYVLGDPFTLLPASVMKAAEKVGVRLLLTGYYGDTLFTGGKFWAVDMIRRLRLGVMARTLFENHAAIVWKRDIFENGLRQFLPPKLVREYRRLRPRAPVANQPGIHPDLATRSDLWKRQTPTDERERFPAAAQWHRYISLTSGHFIYSNEARYQYNKHGMEIAKPYFDRRLVEFVMAVPADELERPNDVRRLHREAMAGLLPDVVRNRREKTTFVPLLLKGFQEKEWETVKAIMADPQVVKRGYIEADWLAERLEHGYDRTLDSRLLWNAICLELWLKRYWA